MKQLNQITTSLVEKFIRQIKDMPELDINLADHPILRISWGSSVTITQGAGRILSIGIIHNRVKNTFEMKMDFIVVSREPVEEMEQSPLIFPIGFEDHVNDVSEESCRIKDGRVESFSAPFQRAHANHAYKWLLEVITAGYLN